MDGIVCVMAGSPVNGVELYGPFKDADRAISWAEIDCPYDSWWIVPLVEPDWLECKKGCVDADEHTNKCMREEER